MTPLGSRVVPEVKAIRAGPPGSVATVPVIGSSASSSSKLLSPCSSHKRSSAPTSPTIGTSAHRSGWNVIRPNSAVLMNTFGRAVAMMWPSSLRP